MRDLILEITFSFEMSSTVEGDGSHAAVTAAQKEQLAARMEAQMLDAVALITKINRASSVSEVSTAWHLSMDFGGGLVVMRQWS